MFSFDGFVRIDRFQRAIYRVAYLNLLWCATTLLGLGIFGFGPASYALAKYMDRWLRHGETPPPGRTFVRYVGEQTWRAMLVGWLVLSTGAVIVTNIFAAHLWVVRELNIVALLVLAMITAYVFPVMAATEVSSIPRQLGGALLIGLGSLHWTIIGAAMSGGLLWLLWSFALPVAVLFGVGIPAYVTAWVTRVVFRPLATSPGTPGQGAVHKPSKRL